MGLNSELIEVLACPKCKNGIRVTEDQKNIICDECSLVYRVDDEIPVMLIDEAEQVQDTAEYK